MKNTVFFDISLTMATLAISRLIATPWLETALQSLYSFVSNWEIQVERNDKTTGREYINNKGALKAPGMGPEVVQVFSKVLDSASSHLQSLLQNDAFFQEAHNHETCQIQAGLL